MNSKHKSSSDRDIKLYLTRPSHRASLARSQYLQYLASAPAFIPVVQDIISGYAPPRTKTRYSRRRPKPKFKKRRKRK